MKTHWTMITLTAVVGTLISAAAWSQQARNDHDAEVPSTIPSPSLGRAGVPPPPTENPFDANATVDIITTGSTSSTYRFPHAQATSKVDQIMRRLREADELHKPDLTKELETAVATEFDADMKQREAELTKLEERVAKLRAQLDRRKKSKTEITQLQTKVLVNEIDGLGFSHPRPLNADDVRAWRPTATALPERADVPNPDPFRPEPQRAVPPSPGDFPR